MAETHHTPPPVRNYIAVDAIDRSPQYWRPAPQSSGSEAEKIAVELESYQQKSWDYISYYAEQAPLPDDQAEYVTEFFAALKLPMKPYVILDNAHSHHNTQVLRDIHQDIWNSRHYGRYSSELGICIINNFLNPNVLKTTIHEEAHAGVMHTTAYEADENGISKPSVVSPGSSKVDARSYRANYPGMIFQAGEWLHESFATLIGESGANVYNYLEQKKRGTEIQLARGEDKYYDDTFRGKTATEGRDGAKALELLIAKDPSFFDVLLEAQQSPQGMIRYVKAVNAVHPHLHRYLRDTSVRGKQAVRNYAALLRQVEIFVGFTYDGQHGKSLAWTHKNGTVERLMLQKILAYRESQTSSESSDLVLPGKVALSSLSKPERTRRNPGRVAGR